MGLVALHLVRIRVVNRMVVARMFLATFVGSISATSSLPGTIPLPVLLDSVRVVQLMLPLASSAS